MTLDELFQRKDELGDEARKWIESTAAFLKTLSEHNLDLEFGASDGTSAEVDYDAPAEDAYKKTYTPIKASEIVEANKQMTEAISGEKWVDGFVTMVKLLLMAK